MIAAATIKKPQTIRERKDLLEKDTWDLSSMYTSIDLWKQEFQEIAQMDWNAISAPFLTKEMLTSEDVGQLFDQFYTFERKLKKLYTYAHLLHDQETSHNDGKTWYKQIESEYMRFSEAFSWIEPKLISLGKEPLIEFLQHPSLKTYETVLERMIRLESHTLSEEMEKLLSMASKATSTGSKAFRALSDADFSFPQAYDSAGQAHDVTHASYGMLLRSEDRLLRRNAFMSVHNQYSMYKNTLSELLSGELEQHWFYAKAKKFDTCLDAALFPKAIDTKVYRSLISAVKKELPLLHRYMKLRKEMLGYKELHMWDLYVPLIQEVNMSIPYDEAVPKLLSSVAILGDEYTSTLQKGLTNLRWVDRFENRSKRSGAYSSGCYDSQPYILMNYKNILRDVFTLAHEAGHSMHSFLTISNQPYHYANYEIFVAEVASTFNEALLSDFLLEQAKSTTEKAFLLNEKLEDIRATLFRQTMFAEFELEIHEMVEQNIPITPKKLEERYLELNREYFGPDVTVDEEIGIEWARIPHFYYNFYVYQYATGISAALSLHERVKEHGAPARDAYLQFLKSGASKFPIDLLKTAGVDMTSPEPVHDAMRYFESLLSQFEQLAVKQQ